MILAEALAALAVFFAVVFFVVIGVKTIWSSSLRSNANYERKIRKLDQMQYDLKNALESRDYHKLDDFLVTWADYASDNIVAHVKQRRDEIYINQ